MAPANSKANYKTYEAQARMVRAIVAAHPEVKWNYKDIAKYFGQSTADGIQFQFRTIKKDADTLRQVEKNGGDVANCLSLGSGGSSSVTATPSKPTPSRGGIGSRSGTARKRTRTMPEIKRTSSDEDDDDDHDTENWSDREETPSKRPKVGAFPGQKNVTSTRKAAAKANVTIAEASAQLDTSDSQPEIETPTAVRTSFVSFSVPSEAPKSIFGPVDQKPTIARNTQAIFEVDRKPALGRNAPAAGSFHGTTFSHHVSDEYMASGLPDDYYMPMNGGGSAFEGDGEI